MRNRNLSKTVPALGFCSFCKLAVPRKNGHGLLVNQCCLNGCSEHFTTFKVVIRHNGLLPTLRAGPFHLFRLLSLTSLRF
jgi:hypothetical protein